MECRLCQEQENIRHGVIGPGIRFIRLRIVPRRIQTDRRSGIYLEQLYSSIVLCCVIHDAVINADVSRPEHYINKDMPFCEELSANSSQVCCVLAVSLTWERNLRVSLARRGLIVFLQSALRHPALSVLSHKYLRGARAQTKYNIALSTCHKYMSAPHVSQFAKTQVSFIKGFSFD